MQVVRFGTLAIALLGASALVAIWPAPAQEPLPRDEAPRLITQNFGTSGGQQKYYVDGKQVAQERFQAFGSYRDQLEGNYLRGQADVETDKLRAQELAAARDVKALIGEYSGSTDEAVRGKLKTKLSAALEKQFDIQQQRRELEATRIEAHLKKIRELMKKRTDARQTIVEKRLDQLVREADGLGWTTPSATLPAGPASAFPALPGVSVK